jgi:hypothetical protein
VALNKCDIKCGQMDMGQLQACEHRNEPLDSIHGGELCDGLSSQGCHSLEWKM